MTQNPAGLMRITQIHQIFANRFLFFREISFISEIGFAELKVRIKKTFRVNSYIIAITNKRC